MTRRHVSEDDDYHPSQAYELTAINGRNSDEKLPEDSTQDIQYDFDDRRVRSSSDSSVRSFELYTPDEERRIIRKLDRRVVTFMSFLYLLSFLDRYNYLTPHVYISLCVLAWGLIASLQSLTTSFTQMLILRLLLGVSEAAFSPGVPYYLSFFYRREELAFRAGMQVSAAPLAASFAGSLAWVITRLGQNGPLAPWRLLFLVEGFPSVLVAVVAWNVIADSPKKARFLTVRERRIAQVRLQGRKSARDVKASEEARAVVKQKVDWARIWATVKDPKCYLTALMFLNCNIAFASMPVFLPTIVREMGYTSLTSQALSAPPYLVSFVTVLLTAALSDRTQSRGPYVIFHALLASSSYLLLSLSSTLHIPNILRYLLVYPACAGFFSAITIIITWTMNNQPSSEGKGVGMTILNLVGQCGPLIGTRAFPDEDAPFYGRGMGVCAGAMGAVFILAVVLRWVLRSENLRSVRERDGRGRGRTGEEDGEGEVEGMLSGAKEQDGRFVLML
ncbi:MAG: hypothetical protein Q9159_004509 [Coniocarpon cinnabarinum]